MRTYCSVIFILLSILTIGIFIWWGYSELKLEEERKQKEQIEQQQKEEKERQKQKELIKESLSELFEEKGVLIEDKDGTSYILDKNGNKVEINIENIEYLENLNVDSLIADSTD